MDVGRPATGGEHADMHEVVTEYLHSIMHKAEKDSIGAAASVAVVVVAALAAVVVVKVLIVVAVANVVVA